MKKEKAIDEGHLRCFENDHLESKEHIMDIKSIPWQTNRACVVYKVVLGYFFNVCVHACV